MSFKEKRGEERKGGGGRKKESYSNYPDNKLDLIYLNDFVGGNAAYSATNIVAQLPA